MKYHLQCVLEYIASGFCIGLGFGVAFPLGVALASYFDFAIVRLIS